MIHVSTSDIKRVYQGIAIKHKLSRWKRWLPPPYVFWKLNTNGSAIENPSYEGFAGVIKNDMGEWVTIFLGHIVITTNVRALFLALKDSLQVAWNHGIRNLEHNLDSLVVINLA